MVGLLLALWLPASAAWAQVIVPPNLAPGSNYRLVFVTGPYRDVNNVQQAGTMPATSGNIADYNAFVTTVANSNATLKALGTTWKAIASTAAVSAKENTATNGTGVPIYHLSGVRVADDYNDLWDASIDAPINVTQDGTTLTSGDGLTVWTGTDTAGNASNPLGSGDVRYGDSVKNNGEWVFSGSSKLVSIPRRLYAMSGELTVSAVPEPASLGLGVAVAATAWWTCRRRRRRARRESAGAHVSPPLVGRNGIPSRTV